MNQKNRTFLPPLQLATARLLNFCILVLQRKQNTLERFVLYFVHVAEIYSQLTPTGHNKNQMRTAWSIQKEKRALRAARWAPVPFIISESQFLSEARKNLKLAYFFLMSPIFFFNFVFITMNIIC